MSFLVFIKKLLKNKFSLIALIIIFTLFIVAIFASYIAPFDPAEIDVLNRLKAPDSDNILGTDALGRDVFSRLIFGTRTSLLVGFVAVGISVFIGLVLGTLSGYYGGIVDGIVMRFCDLMLCFPSMFLILAVIAILEPSIWNVMIVIGLTSWMGAARLVRAEFISLKNRDFVLAAKGSGASNFRIILKYILPNAMAPVLVTASLGIGGAILVESGLSFLGLGVQPPISTWGSMLTDGKDYIQQAWWLTFYPGIFILITVLSYNLLGEGLRDALDPRN